MKKSVLYAKIENHVESVLWSSRLMVFIAVVMGLFSSVAMFYIATLDTWFLLSHLGDYASSSLDAATRAELRNGYVSHVVEIIDGYLLATVLLIFALGLYELFISKIDAAQSSETGSNVLLIHSLDDLKSRLAKVIIMILIVKLFEHAINMSIEQPMDLLLLAASIALVGLALYLTHAGEGPSGGH